MKNRPLQRPPKQAPVPEVDPNLSWSEQARQKLHQIGQFILTARRVTKESIDWFANFLFDTTVASGRFRRWLFIILAGAVWGVAAFLDHRPTPTSDFFVYPIQALLHPRILRHVLVFGLTFWIALKVSSIYLDDVFELENPEIAERYILQASLANQYPNIEIKDGQVRDGEDSTIVRIGGPGLVRVHYDSAALFEKFNGDPTVIIAEDELVALDRFERLRKVLRLRDHIEETNIATRTRDGIPVRADGVRIKYYILRYEDLPGTEKVPFPVVREAVEKQVYRERVSRRLNPLALNDKPDDKAPEKKEKHPETLNISPGPITAELKKFISSTTLSEFLAAISERELNQLIEDSQQLDRDAMSMSGAVPVSNFDEEDSRPTAAPPDFKPRSDITRQIYESFRKHSRLSFGLELNWIDIGTWVLPENAEQIVRQHEVAWHKSLDNLKYRSDGALAASEMDSMIKTTRILLRDIIYEFSNLEETAPPAEIINALLNQYVQKLGLALDLYQKQARSIPKPGITRIQNLGLVDTPEKDDGGSPLQINRALAHLSSLLKLYKTTHNPGSGSPRG
jgi:hypothetical protein